MITEPKIFWQAFDQTPRLVLIVSMVNIGHLIADQVISIFNLLYWGFDLLLCKIEPEIFWQAFDQTLPVSFFLSHWLILDILLQIK